MLIVHINIRIHKGKPIGYTHPRAVYEPHGLLCIHSAVTKGRVYTAQLRRPYLAETGKREGQKVTSQMGEYKRESGGHT